ncbi:MoaD/ThiS family protein [Aeromicrobium sp. 636]|uniref:MoaD/ThiS family protein n=1 Tax=Aeromicrobium senzhongii TaxID=2663859 RepID=A0A8I0EUR5_9ACTN|nr:MULTISPECIES: MoaD/ThiS family protein [Aeromicrobium]MBC9225919.1 MoaD/ThiS family protein [Aeromicrobium senzhongii]MCQ3998026.1 MoaD/ThiS family protein [Aeromicrobium sp. 636]MTB87942.1 MoaD/ThiS family protein [Aeromicrobium senzhongii]QNL95042.1 MoaD/ThiS family protein [Aeromicrobium senzhongii]
MEPVHVRLFAAAREAAGTSETSLVAGTLGELLDGLAERFVDLGPVLTRCSVLVEGIRTTDRETVLPPGLTVDVLPPFAGG